MRFIEILVHNLFPEGLRLTGFILFSGVLVTNFSKFISLFLAFWSQALDLLIAYSSKGDTDFDGTHRYRDSYLYSL